MAARGQGRRDILSTAARIIALYVHWHFSMHQQDFDREEEAGNSGERADEYDQWIRTVLVPKLEECRER